MITHDRLKELLRYNPATGEFVRLVSLINFVKVGSVAGHIQKRHGYVRISVDGHSYFAHRLAWLYMTGRFPALEIDHKDRNPSNNCWSNLREATHSQNQANTKVYKTNKIGLKGVHLYKGRYRAMLSIAGKNKHIGYFGSSSEASEAYKRVASQVYGEAFL